MNVADFLCRSARCFPDRPAVTWREDTLSYVELDCQARALQAWLHSIGVAQDSRVVLFMDNRPEMLAAMFGVFRSGATLVPCNARLTADELRYLIGDAEATLVITDDAHEETARLAAGEVQVCVAGPELDAILSVDPGPMPPTTMAPSDVAWLFYTSGTTGQPKGAMLSHRLLEFVTVSWLADLTPLDETDVTLHAAPLSHGAGFHAIAATARGTHQVFTPTASFDPVGTLELLGSMQVTNTWLVPTQIVMLTQAVVPGAQYPSLRHVVYGAAPMTSAAITAALTAFGPVFVQLYGQGETPMTATVLRRQDHLPDLFGSVGRARLGIDLAIMGDDGQFVQPGHVGEVVVQGPSVMSGYWRRPDATAETLRGGWLHTGDLGRMTDDGFLYLLDRAKDMIITGGSNVYAIEVEDVLSTHASVKDVAVIGTPDALWGELVVAVVVLPDGASLDASALEVHCRASLAGYKIPRRWLQVESLPRNVYGKVLKRELRASLESSTAA